MTNKILLIIIILLVPVSLLFLLAKEEIVENKNLSYNNINITLDYKNEQLTLSLDDYLYGVVAAEMPALFQDEALKAQAVVSRTFALYTLQNRSILTLNDQGYLTEEELKTKWQDKFLEYSKKIKNAVEETKNQVITYDDNLIKSYYFAMTNGKTEDAKIVFNESYPYLQVVESSYDNSSLKNFIVTTSFSKESFCEILNISCSEIVISNVMYDLSDRVSTITINDQQFSGIDIRKLLSLRSTDFDIQVLPTEITITTKGYGHGVGLSQYGANGMALNGSSFQDIINYYYNNVEIQDFTGINLQI